MFFVCFVCLSVVVVLRVVIMGIFLLVILF